MRAISGSLTSFLVTTYVSHPSQAVRGVAWHQACELSRRYTGKQKRGTRLSLPTVPIPLTTTVLDRHVLPPEALMGRWF